MNLYKKSTAKRYSFFVIYATLASYYPSCFKKKSFRKNTKTSQDNCDDKIRDEKQQFYIYLKANSKNISIIIK